MLSLKSACMAWAQLFARAATPSTARSAWFAAWPRLPYTAYIARQGDAAGECRDVGSVL